MMLQSTFNFKDQDLTIVANPHEQATQTNSQPSEQKDKIQGNIFDNIFFEAAYHQFSTKTLDLCTNSLKQLFKPRFYIFFLYIR